MNWAVGWGKVHGAGGWEGEKLGLVCKIKIDCFEK